MNNNARKLAQQFNWCMSRPVANILQSPVLCLSLQLSRARGMGTGDCRMFATGLEMHQIVEVANANFLALLFKSGS